jgi:hypothetical protein
MAITQEASPPAKAHGSDAKTLLAASGAQSKVFIAPG